MAKSYEEMATEALAMEAETSYCDSDPVTAAIVEKLRKENPDADESALWAQARDAYWKYRDAQQEAERKGKSNAVEEMDSEDPSSMMMDD